jgi:hypothetical protein
MRIKKTERDKKRKKIIGQELMGMNAEMCTPEGMERSEGNEKEGKV